MDRLTLFIPTVIFLIGLAKAEEPTLPERGRLVDGKAPYTFTFPDKVVATAYLSLSGCDSDVPSITHCEISIAAGPPSAKLFLKSGGKGELPMNKDRVYQFVCNEKEVPTSTLKRRTISEICKKNRDAWDLSEQTKKDRVKYDKLEGEYKVNVENRCDTIKIKISAMCIGTTDAVIPEINKCSYKGAVALPLGQEMKFKKDKADYTLECLQGLLPTINKVN